MNTPWKQLQQVRQRREDSAQAALHTAQQDFQLKQRQAEALDAERLQLARQRRDFLVAQGQQIASEGVHLDSMRNATTFLQVLSQTDCTLLVARARLGVQLVEAQASVAEALYHYRQCSAQKLRIDEVIQAQQRQFQASQAAREEARAEEQGLQTRMPMHSMCE